MFETAGPESLAIAKLWWILLAVSLGVFFVVVISVLGGLMRSRDRENNPDMEQTLGQSLAWATAFTVVTLVATLVITYEFSKPQVNREKADVVIEVTGRMWWWEVRYLDEFGNELFATANEIVIPIDQNILFKLRSKDVIHSFWVPSLGGKIDMIPGHENELWLRADKIGEYRGQCAEFCGVQHAKMSLLVFAVSDSEYKKWSTNQIAPAKVVPTFAQGLEVFKASGCLDCHSIRPELALRDAGPDLTHFATRKTLAAVSAPNNTGHLAGWIADPQSMKPGNLMPATLLSPEDFKALLLFLRSLK